MRGRKEKIYAMYKGEEMLAMGTLREISAQMGVTIATLRFYTTPASRRRSRGHVRREVFPLDDLED